MVKARSCCSLARPVLGNHGSPARFWDFLLASRTYACAIPAPRNTHSALYPIIGQMERAAGLARDDSSPAKLDKLDRVLKQTSTSAQDAALFAEMLSLPNDGRYPAVELAPQ